MSVSLCCTLGRAEQSPEVVTQKDSNPDVGEGQSSGNAPFIAACRGEIHLPSCRQKGWRFRFFNHPLSEADPKHGTPKLACHSWTVARRWGLNVPLELTSGCVFSVNLWLVGLVLWLRCVWCTCQDLMLAACRSPDSNSGTRLDGFPF